MRLIDPSSGRILLDDADIATLSRGALRPHRRSCRWCSRTRCGR
ncbi:hypothetical protein FLP41_10105 [Paracoccus marcusii]|nr:hypothetical protein FLP41_10105 [Paracoccus marcusii]